MEMEQSKHISARCTG